MDNFLCENHRGSPPLTLLTVLNLLNVVDVLNVLDIPKDASLVCCPVWLLGFRSLKNINFFLFFLRVIKGPTDGGTDLM